MNRTMGRARPLLAGLAVFDLLLGGTAVFFPGVYLGLLHPGFAGGPTYLLLRTGMLWLFFAAMEAWGALRPAPLLLVLVGSLRLMDVPADLATFASAGDLGTLGRVAYLGSPVFNLLAGIWLVATGLRARD